MPTPRNLPAGPTQGGAGTYGRVPGAPDPTQTLGDVLSGNIANLGQLYNLGGQLNKFIAQQAAVPFQLNLPNYQNMLNQSSGNIQSNLRGEIPQDVRNLLTQQTAERGVSTGSIGSDNSNAALLRALGLTSLGLQQQGETELSQAIARTPTGQQFDPRQFLTDPNTQLQMQYLANILASAPTPGAGDRLNLQQLLNGLRGGLGAGGGGGIRSGGGGGNTDLLGFQIPNMQAPGANAGGWTGWFGPGATTSPGVTSTINRSGMQGVGTAGQSLSPGLGFGTWSGPTTLGPGNTYFGPASGFGNLMTGAGTNAPPGGSGYDDFFGTPAEGDWSYDLGGGDDFDAMFGPDY